MEDDATIQHERDVKFDFHTGRDVVFGDRALRELAGDGGRDNYFVFAASLVVREASFPRLAMDRSHCETHRTCAQFSGK